MGGWTWGLAALLGLAVVATLMRFGLPPRRTRRGPSLLRAQQEFHLRRERLEADFLKRAAASGRPRGLRWTGCEFDNAVAYARDRVSGEISAFVAVTVAFEAVEGGPMEDVEAVSNLRAASAVFRYVQRQWTTDGRAMFNLNPAEAIAYYHERFELVGQEA